MKNYFKMLVPAIMLVSSVSCSENFDIIPSGDDTKSTVETLDAKEYFEAHAEDLAFPNLNLDIVQTKTLSERNPIAPKWNKSRTIKGDEFDVVQVPLENGEKLIALKESVIKGNTTKEMTQWFSYLLVTRNNKTANRDMLVFSIIPDSKWLKANPQGVTSIKFDEYVKGNLGRYSGVILVSFLDGRVSSGIRYVDGKITHRLSTNLSSHNRLRQEMRAPSSFKMCIHGSRNSEARLKTRSYAPDNSEETCIQEQGNSGWCGACLDWHEHETGADSDTAPVYGQDDAPSTFPKQSSKNTCVTSSFAYVSNIFGMDATEQHYNSEILKKGVDVVNGNEGNGGGLTVGQTTVLANALFKTHEFTSYKDAIDAGQVIMTNVGGHSVVIVGYCRDTFSYMDPEVGYLQAATEEQFGSFYNIPISGL